MTIQPPTQDPTNLYAPAQVQTAGDRMFHDSLSQAARAIILKHYILSAVKKNEKQQVLTGVSIKDLKTGRMLVGHNQDTEQFAASINKLPVVLLVLEDLRAGKLNMDQVMTWTEADRRAGFGEFDQTGSPLQAPLKDVIYDLLNKSGNTAVRILVNGALGGAAAVNERWAAEPNLAHTYLQPVDANRFFLGNSTPHDALWTIEQLLNERDSYSRFMKRAMAGNIFTDFGVRSQLGDNDSLVLVNKIGLLDDVEGNNRHDVGIIYNKQTKRSYAYAFFTTAPYSETDRSATERADQSLKDMGRYTLRYAGGGKLKHGKSGAYGSYQRMLEKRVRY
jgi:beta-lactamase class A